MIFHSRGLVPRFVKSLLFFSFKFLRFLAWAKSLGRMAMPIPDSLRRGQIDCLFTHLDAGATSIYIFGGVTFTV
jgi:hypothetical protein